MKSTFAIFVAALLAVPTITKAFNIDGLLDAQYGSAIVTQQLNTSTSDNTEGLIGQANGTELDAAYGTISNGVLYLFLAGNLDSDDVADNITFDKLHIFFMTGPGGDHTLGTNYNGAADYGHLNRMGVGGNGDPNAVGTAGLTFDRRGPRRFRCGSDKLLQLRSRLLQLRRRISGPNMPQQWPTE